jgi:integrase
MNLRKYLEWANTTSEQMIQDFKTAQDKSQWSKDVGNRIMEWYNQSIGKGIQSNVARTMTIAVRAFLGSQCDRVRIKRGRIANTKPAMGDHEFKREELAKMFHYADVNGKALLSLGISLGWGIGDILELKWADVGPFLDSPFVGFYWQRGKTDATIRAHLTPEACDSLKQWRRLNPDAEYVFEKRKRTLNSILKSLAEKAGIQLRGTVHFHLLRKFLMRQLSNAHMNEWHVKFLIGKTVPADIATYLQQNSDQLIEEYKNAYPRFALTDVSREAVTKLEEVIEALKQQAAEIERPKTRIADVEAKGNVLAELETVLTKVVS